MLLSEARKHDRVGSWHSVNSTIDLDEKTEPHFDGDNSSPRTTGFSPRSDFFRFHALQHTRPFHSRLIEDAIDKPWLRQKSTTAELFAVWIVRIGSILSCLIVVAFAYQGWTAWETNKYCLVLEDNFDTFDETVWTREVELGGFGTGEFEWTTPFDENLFVKENKLHLVPTLQAWPQKEGSSLNLTALGLCTADPAYSGRPLRSACEAMTNGTLGTFLPPVQSARINTRQSHSIRYGRVEVTARLPVGDWIWPAIWMLPSNNTYGIWPQSGEIDIMESRGNGPDFCSVDRLGAVSAGGHDTVVSTLHWGTQYPYVLDQSGLTTNGFTLPSRTDSLTKEFHTFGMEWTPNSIRTYVDKKLTRIASFPMPKKGFWEKGLFNTISLGQGYDFANPWVAANSQAPFDQEFYLVINLAVGGLGYFDTIDGRLPWNVGDGRDEAMRQFMEAKDTWYPTWGSPEERSLVVSRVKMWQMCN